MCNDQTAVFRGVVSGDTGDNFCTLDTWHQLGSAVLIGTNLRFIDGSCAFMIPSLESRYGGCEGISGGSNIINAPVAVGSSTSVVALLVASAAVVVVSVVGVMHVRRK
jgi:hypothetical protein